MQAVIGIIRLLLSWAPLAVRVLQATLYLLTHRRQVYEDLKRAAAALEDWQLTKEEAQQIREAVERHLRGLGLRE